MIRQKALAITALALLVIIAIQTLIIIRPEIVGSHEVTTEESAIIIAKAAIIKRYGEKELQGVELEAFIHEKENPYYWRVSTRIMGYGPHILVRVSDGKVILRWK